MPNRLQLSEERILAYHKVPGAHPGVLFCGGFASDMTGTKATHLEAHCRQRGQAFVRFDYTGHGQSSGRFEDGTIGAWASDAIAVVDCVTEGPLVVVGSSMGGWIMLLLALARPARVEGLIGIAPAPDFTAELIEPQLSSEQRAALARDGICYEPSDYGDPLPITQHLLDEGRAHLLMGDPIGFDGPVHLLHGQRDPDVPWPTSLALAERLASENVTIELIKDGDHQLSREADLARLTAALDRVSASIADGR